jgi:hypothetical protein
MNLNFTFKYVAFLLHCEFTAYILPVVMLFGSVLYRT